MKTKQLTTLFVLFLSLGAFSQERFEVKKIGFSMDFPKDWIEVKNEEVFKNLNLYDFSEEQLNELLKSNNAAVNLVTYTKYDSKTYTGIIPTIKIRTRSNKISNIENFRKSIESLTETVMKSLDNFKFTEKPTIITISNNEAVKFTVHYTLKNNGKEYPVVSHSYYILQNGYYISLNFIEEINKENNEKLFEDLVNSIQITE